MKPNKGSLGRVALLVLLGLVLVGGVSYAFWQNKSGTTTLMPQEVSTGNTTATSTQATQQQQNTSSSASVSIISPKAGATLVSGKTSTIQISFSSDFAKKVGALIDAGNSAATQPLSMGLLSKRTGEIITLPPPSNRELHSDVINGSLIRTGSFSFALTPRTAVVANEWNGASRTYLVPGEYKVVVYSRNANAEGAIGKIYTTNDGWFSITNGTQAGVSFEILQPQGEQSFSKGDTLALRWRLAGSDTSFIPKYFSAELVPADYTKQYAGTFSGFSSCRLTSTFGGIAIPASNTFDWSVPTSAAGVPHLADPETPLCSMTGVPAGKYRIIANISTCSGHGCMEDNNQISISDTSGVIVVK